MSRRSDSEMDEDSEIGIMGEFCGKTSCEGVVLRSLKKESCWSGVGNSLPAK